MFYKQFSDARDTYKELMVSLDFAKIDTNKKLKIQKETQRALDAFNKAKDVRNDPNVKIAVPGLSIYLLRLIASSGSCT